MTNICIYNHIDIIMFCVPFWAAGSVKAWFVLSATLSKPVQCAAQCVLCKLCFTLHSDMVSVHFLCSNGDHQIILPSFHFQWGTETKTKQVQSRKTKCFRNDNLYLNWGSVLKSCFLKNLQKADLTFMKLCNCYLSSIHLQALIKWGVTLWANNPV